MRYPVLGKKKNYFCKRVFYKDIQRKKTKAKKLPIFINDVAAGHVQGRLVLRKREQSRIRSNIGAVDQYYPIIM